MMAGTQVLSRMANFTTLLEGRLCCVNKLNRVVGNNNVECGGRTSYAPRRF